MMKNVLVTHGNNYYLILLLHKHFRTEASIYQNDNHLVSHSLDHKKHTCLFQDALVDI